VNQRSCSVLACLVAASTFLGAISTARADPSGDLPDAAPNGASAQVLAQARLSWPATSYGPFSVWQIGLNYERYRIEPNRSTEYSSAAESAPRSDVFFVENGEVTMRQGGRSQTVTEGGVYFSEDHRDPGEETHVTITNDGTSCAAVLRLSTGGCVQCGGGPLENQTPPQGPSTGGCAARKTARLFVFGASTPSTFSFLARISVDAHTEWNLGDRLGTIMLVVERGTLTTRALSGDYQQTGRGDALELRSNDPHRIVNDGDGRLTVLVFGVMSDPAGSGVLEIHRAHCPPGARAPYFADCHHLGEEHVPYSVVDPGGYDALGTTSIGVTDAVDDPGPGIAIFRGIPAGRYHLAEEGQDDPSRQDYIYCADHTGLPASDAPKLAEFSGPTAAGIDVEIPGGAYVICDWYAEAY
jgi:hypothetical protein